MGNKFRKGDRIIFSYSKESPPKCGRIDWIPYMKEELLDDVLVVARADCDHTIQIETRSGKESFWYDDDWFEHACEFSESNKDLDDFLSSI